MQRILTEICHWDTKNYRNTLVLFGIGDYLGTIVCYLLKKILLSYNFYVTPLFSCLVYYDWQKQKTHKREEVPLFMQIRNHWCLVKFFSSHLKFLINDRIHAFGYNEAYPISKRLEKTAAQSPRRCFALSLSFLPVLT